MLAVLESPVQRGCLEVFQLYGYRAWRLGQRDARGTQDSGPADIFATHALDGAVWCECKRPIGGKWSRSQQEFAAAVVAAGGTYVLAHDPKILANTLAELRRERLADAARRGLDRNGVESLARTGA